MDKNKTVFNKKNIVTVKIRMFSSLIALILSISSLSALLIYVLFRSELPLLERDFMRAYGGCSILFSVLFSLYGIKNKYRDLALLIAGFIFAAYIVQLFIYTQILHTPPWFVDN